MQYLSWGTILGSSVQSLWISVIDFLPKLLGALVVLLVGFIVASAASHFIKRLIQIFRIDSIVSRLKIEAMLEHAGIKIVVSEIFAWLIKWFLIIAFFVTAVGILEWQEIVLFLNSILLYLPNVAVAVSTILIGMVVSSFVAQTVRKIVLSAKMDGEVFLSELAKWAILIFAIMAALIQLKVASELIQTLFTGLVAMLALAGGLAFGIGGKEKAGELLDGWSKHFKKKKK